MHWGNKDSRPFIWLCLLLSLAVLALSFKQYNTTKALEQTKQDLEECKSEKSRINFELDVRERRQLSRPEQDSMR